MNNCVVSPGCLPGLGARLCRVCIGGFLRALSPHYRTRASYEQQMKVHLWEGQEACDDSNTTNGDGCSANCTVELPTCASLSFDGTDDYVELPDSDAWALGSGDFTIALWTKLESISGRFLQQRETNDARFAFYLDSVSYLWFGQKNPSYDEVYLPWEPTLQSWQHVAVVRSGGTLEYFIDGVSLGTLSYTPWAEVVIPQEAQAAVRGGGWHLKRTFWGVWGTAPAGCGAEPREAKFNDFFAFRVIFT